jgi:hypothetical protein
MPSPERGRWGLRLRSQGLGLLCGFGTVLLLAVGSFVLAATRDGASASIHLDDLRGFLARPSAVHSWFYLLVSVLGLYVLNTTLATWHSLARKLRARVTAPARYAPALFHLAFLLALVAHGLAGLRGEEQGETVLPVGRWQRLPGDREARLLSLEVDRLPGGMPREVRADLELRGAAGKVERARVGYNQPISAGWGAQLDLLADLGTVAVAEVSMGSERCALFAGGPCRLGGLELELGSAAEAGRAGPTAMAQVGMARPGQAPWSAWLVEGREVPAPDGRPLRLESLAPRPAILLRSRAAPGNPWALASALVIAAGVALLWRRFLPRADAPAAEPD